MNYGFNQYGQQPFYQPPLMGQLEQLRSQQYQPMQTEQSNNGVIWVQGEAGAKSYMVARGNSVLLMDSEAHNFYIKSTDASGMPSMRVFSYTEITNSNNIPPVTQTNDYVTRQEFNALVAKIESTSQPIRRRVKEANADAEPAV